MKFDYEYYDEWLKKWVDCKVFDVGDIPIDDWYIMPLEGNFVGVDMCVSPNDVRKKEVG